MTTHEERGLAQEFSRREVLRAGLGALAFSGGGRFMSVLGQALPAPKNGLIDVHHHFVPPFCLPRQRILWVH